MASNVPLCGPCESENEHHQALSWCSTCGEGLCRNCSKEHKKNRSSSKHPVVLLESMSRLSETISAKWNHCETHSEKEISLFCRNHDQLCCTLCIPGFHRKCDDVISIEQASKRCRQGFALSDLQKRIENLKHIYDSILKKKNDNSIALENESVLIEQHIPSRNVTAYLKKTKKTREDFSTKRNMLTQRIAEECDEITNRKTRLNSFSTYLHTLIKDEEDQQLFVAIKKFDTALYKLEQEMQTDQFTKLHSIFQERRSSDISNTLATLQIIEHKMDDIPELAKLNQCQSLLIGSGILKLTKTLDLNKLVESGRAWVWKVCCFPSIKKVSFTSGSCIYIYDTESGMLDTMKLDKDFDSFYITTFDNNHALVASLRGQLLKVNISDLSFEEDIAICSGRQFAICCVGDYLLVGSGCIIVSKQGRIIRQIPVSGDVGYMCPYGDDTFIYTSYYHKTIECMTLNGNSVFKITSSDLNNHFKDECHYSPMGVCVDKYHFIYVVLFEQHILRLTPEGKIDKFVLDLESGGFGMAYNSATHEIIFIHRLDIIEFYKID